MPRIERITHNVDRIDYDVFIRQLRDILAEHGDNPRQYVRDSHGNIHYVLAKQRGKPKRWIHIKLELDDGAETTLRVRDDNVYLIGFENKGGELFEFGFSGTMMVDGRKKNKSDSMLGESRFLECDVSYGSLVHGGARTLVNMPLGPELTVRSAVGWLSGYAQGDGGRVDEGTRRALAFLIVMVCEATRMRPLQIQEGWHAQYCCIDHRHVDYIWSWGDMSEALLRWKRDPDTFEFPQCLRDIGVEHASHALDIVELLLNTPIDRPPQWRRERYQRLAASDDDARRSEQQRDAAGDRDSQRPPTGEHGSGSRGKQQSPPPPNTRTRTEQQHDQDQDQQQLPPLPSDKGSGDSHLQETPPESSADDYVARGRPLMEVFAVHAGFHFVGTISVFDGMRGQVIYENDNNGGAPPIHGSSSSSGHDDQLRPLLLTGPYRAISAYGSITIEVDISGAGDVGELDWDCYDKEKVYDKQVTETITTSSSGRKVHVTYAVLSDAVDAELEVHLRLPGATAAAVYGRIATRSKAFRDEDTASSVLFDSEVEGVPLVADSRGFITRLPLARSVVAMPLGWPLLIMATLYDAPPSQHGVSPVFQFQDMELTLDMRRSSADNGGGKFEVSITSPDHCPRPRRNDTATRRRLLF